MSIHIIRRKLPILSHLQFAITYCIGLIAPVSGKELRTKLNEVFGIKKSGPGFYQLMARLEENKLVTGWYKQEVIDGQIIRERTYDLTPNGAKALEDASLFYEVIK